MSTHNSWTRRFAGLITILALGAPMATAASSDGIRQISRSGSGAYEAGLAASGDGFAVAWYDTRNGHPEIYARLIGSNGVPAGPELRLTNGHRAAYEPDIATAGTHLVVAWYERGPGSETRALLGSWTSEGELLWTRSLSDGRYGKSPVVRVRDQDVFCAWLDFAPAALPRCGRSGLTSPDSRAEPQSPSHRPDGPHGI